MSITVIAGNHSIDAPVVLQSDVAINTAAGANLTISDVISGPGKSLTKSDAGTLVLTGNNIYSGPTNFTGGLIQAASLDNLGTGTLLDFGGGGLQWAPSSTFDPSSRTMTFTGEATLDTNGNTVTLVNSIGNAGPG